MPAAGQRWPLCVVEAPGPGGLGPSSSSVGLGRGAGGSSPRAGRSLGPQVTARRMRSAQGQGGWALGLDSGLAAHFSGRPALQAWCRFGDHAGRCHSNLTAPGSADAGPHPWLRQRPQGPALCSDLPAVPGLCHAVTRGGAVVPCQVPRERELSVSETPADGSPVSPLSGPRACLRTRYRGLQRCLLPVGARGAQ